MTAQLKAVNYTTANGPYSRYRYRYRNNIKIRIHLAQVSMTWVVFVLYVPEHLLLLPPTVSFFLPSTSFACDQNLDIHSTH